MSEPAGGLFQEAFALHEASRLDEAQERYERLLAQDPEHADALHLLGSLLHQRGENERGAELIEAALKIRPGNATFLYNLGVIYGELGNGKRAGSCYRESLSIEAGNVSAWVNLGNLLSNQGRFAEAGSCRRRALALEPDVADHQFRLANTLKMQGFVEEALSHYGNALALDPSHAAAHSALLFASQYEPGIDLNELAQRHLHWWEQHGKDNVHSDQPAAPASPPEILRIGFVSPDFGNHPVGIFLAPLLERLATYPEIETICYSDSGKQDEFTDRNRSAADYWRDIPQIDDESVAAQIRADAIEILFDLTGHTERNRMRLFARKPAPIQVTWAGYVGSTGLETIDYILTDSLHTPESADPFYTETPIRLPHDYIPYEPPGYAPDVTPLPMLETGYPVFGCLNNPSKISLPTIRTWSEILRRLPEARMILKYKGMNDPAVRSRIHGLFSAHGISPERIELLGQTQHREHLETFHRIDVTLDPFPYSSGLSACESLWMGVPVITCPGDTFASRHSLSHLFNAGITGSCANDMNEYIEMAIGFVQQPEDLATVRGSLRKQVAQSPLCDLDGFTASFVEAMTKVRKR